MLQINTGVTAGIYVGRTNRKQSRDGMKKEVEVC